MKRKKAEPVLMGDPIIPFKKINIDKTNSILDSPLLLDGHIVYMEGKLCLKVAPYSWEVYNYKKTVFGK